MNENTLMPYGKYKGIPLKDVPAKYLLKQYTYDWLRDPLKKWIEDNQEQLLIRARTEKA